MSNEPDLTPEQMIEAWRDLRARGISVQTGTTWKTSENEEDECTFTFFDTTDDGDGEMEGVVAESQDVDPLRAFSNAYRHMQRMEARGPQSSCSCAPGTCEQLMAEDSEITRTLTAEFEADYGTPDSDVARLGRIAADHRRLVGLVGRVNALAEHLRTNAKSMPDFADEADYVTGWRHGMLNAANVVEGMLRRALAGDGAGDEEGAGE